MIATFLCIIKWGDKHDRIYIDWTHFFCNHTIAYFFLSKDRVKEVEEQVEQLTLSTMQQLYEIKSELKRLKKSCLSEWSCFSTEEQIWHLHKQGWTKEQIARKLNMPIDEVNIVIARNER